jgi:protein CpxP
VVLAARLDPANRLFLRGTALNKTARLQALLQLLGRNLPVWAMRYMMMFLNTGNFLCDLFEIGADHPTKSGLNFHATLQSFWFGASPRYTSGAHFSPCRRHLLMQRLQPKGNHHEIKSQTLTACRTAGRGRYILRHGSDGWPMCDMSGGGMSGRHGMQQSQRGKMDPARMQARMEQRHAMLKTQLKLTAEQEGAWTSFNAAHKAPGMMNQQRPDPAEMAKLTTPERIDKMKAMRAEHQAEADKRADATKAFYAVLTADQKKVFDSFAMQGPGRHKGSRMGMQPMPPKQ